MAVRPILALLGVTLVASCGGPRPPLPPTPVTPAAAVPVTITPGELRRDLFVIAADSFRGREAGTTDATRAAAFLAERLAELGLEPAGDSGYLQRLPLVREEYTAATRFDVTIGETVVPLAFGDDVVPILSLGAGSPEPRRSAAGELVFVGYGMDYPPPRREAVEGKVAVVVHGAPNDADSATKQRMEAHSEFSARLGRLLKLRPAAVIVLMTGGTTAFYDEILPELLRPLSAAAKDSAPTISAQPYPMVLVGLARPGSPLLPPGWPRDDRPQALAGRFSGRIDVTRRPVAAYNVVAVVPGSDARLRNTYVAYGAHYDHIGVVHPRGTPAARDTIANGADDDASGTVSLLAIARQMRRARPKRSILFVWHTAEEKGMLGSAFFTAHPPVPADSIVAELNADMVGRNSRGRLYVVGPRAAARNRVLGAIVDSVNKTLAEPFELDRSWDADDDPEQRYQRSDHYNYALHGIPVVFFTTGLHADYHTVRDEAERIDYVKLANVDRLLFEVGIAVANRERRPW